MPFVLEEAHEVVEAVERRDLDELKGEIGDLMFEGVFLSQLCAESGDFTITDALTTSAPSWSGAIRMSSRRSASTESITTPDAVKDRWERSRRPSGPRRGARARGIDGVPKGLPALLRGPEIGNRAAATASTGRRRHEVVAKIDEEIGEVREALEPGSDRDARRRGDRRPALRVANLARKLAFDPEAALRAANRKFDDRFRAMEARLAATRARVGARRRST